jgi:hypothetical protein
MNVGRCEHVPNAIAHVSCADGAASLLASTLAVVVEAVFAEKQCAAWAAAVQAARSDWTTAFGGEQYSLGRAFYTDFEEDESRHYFDDAAASDARVEAHLPGFQGAMRDVVARVTGSRVVPRRGWCGPGVHVFPAGAPVANDGGIVHFDVEGLSALHRAAREPAITLIAMLQAPEADGHLDVWDIRYDGHDRPRDVPGERPVIVRYRLGDVVVIDSYRLHRIRPFGGARARISGTVHASVLDRDLWECWF